MSTTTATKDSLKCKICGNLVEAGLQHVCEECFGPLEVQYDLAEISRILTREKIESRYPDLFRYRELLPLEGPPKVGKGVGFTPLLPAPTLGEAIGIRDLWIKCDNSGHPTQSFKDRVVAVAINRAIEFDLDVVGCASTGNLANAVAAQAAAAGLEAWIFVPADLEAEKILATAVHGPQLVRIEGTYDDVNRLCAEVADDFGWGIVNVNLRPYYSEGSKSMAFEIAEQLGWAAPRNVVAPMAGGSLITKLQKGFIELDEVGLLEGGHDVSLYGAQAEGCAPIIHALHEELDRIRPVREPNTIAKSLAIGNPADGPFAVKTMKESGGWGETVTDDEIREGMYLLGRTEGIFTETAGGVTVATAAKLAKQGRIEQDGPTVLCITGNGLKTPDPVRVVVDFGSAIEPRLSEVERLREESKGG